MLELFVIGSFWFWALIVVELLVLFAFVANENGFGATMSAVICAALLQFFGNTDIIGYAVHNPWHIVALVGSYFLIGTTWAVFKWWLHVRDQVEEYEDLKSDWLRGRGVTNTRVIPDELKDAWKSNVKTSYTLSKLSTVPVVKDNKARILRWMGFWWVSMIWSLINDFVTRIFRSIYYRISSTLQKIADRLYARIKSDLE